MSQVKASVGNGSRIFSGDIVPPSVKNILEQKRFSKGMHNSKNLGSGQLPTFLEVEGCNSSPVKLQESRKKAIREPGIVLKPI